MRADIDRIGLLFLNFRSPRKFDEEEKNTFFTFAHLAALAIQKAQFHQQQIQFERENLARQLHDHFMANVDASSRLISSMLRDEQVTDPWRSRLEIAQDAMQELKRDLKYLNDTLKDIGVDNLPDEVKKLIQRARSAYGVTFDVQWTGRGHLVSPVIASQIKLILNEAIINAIKHGDATRISLAIEISNGQVTVMIEDNGQGFDIARVKPGGLANMRERTERLGGVCSVDSAPGKGTRVLVSVPYSAHEGDSGLAK